LTLLIAIKVKRLRPAATGQQQGAETRETQKNLLHGTTVSKNFGAGTRGNQVRGTIQI